MLKIVAISHSFRLGPKNFDQKFFQNGGSKINIQKYLNFSTAAIHWRGHKHMGELAYYHERAHSFVKAGLALPQMYYGIKIYMHKRQQS